jgi:hypothetical protein
MTVNHFMAGVEPATETSCKYIRYAQTVDNVQHDICLIQGAI